MSTVTAVPLQPVRRRHLIWLWMGIGLALVAAVGLARAAAGVWLTLPGGSKLETLHIGKGPMPTDADVVLVSYVGKLANGTVFDQSPQPVPFPVAQVVPGFSQGLKHMQRGGRYRLVIPPAQGYGDKTSGPIPANSTLTFEVQLIDFKSEAEIRQIQMMQSQGAALGASGQPQAMPPQP